MLDEFVGFARMNPPVIADINLHEWLDALKALYQNDIESGRLVYTTIVGWRQLRLILKASGR